MPVCTLTPGPNTTFGPIVTSGASCVSAHRNTEPGSIMVTPASIAALRSQDCTTASAAASSARELMPATSSAGASTAATCTPSCARQADQVREVVFALGIMRPHRLQPAQHVAGGGAQHAGVAQADPAQRLVGVGPFDDLLHEPVAADHPAVLAGIGRAERQQRQPGVAARPAGEQPAQRVDADQRVVGVQHGDVAVAELLRRLQCGMRGAQPVLLHHRGVRRRLALHGVHAGANHHNDAVEHLFAARQQVTQHGAAGNLVQGLGA